MLQSSLKIFCNISPEIILFFASLVDRAILLIFQAFIFQVKCLEKADTRRYQAYWNLSVERICAVGIKNSNDFGSLEREVSVETSRWVLYAGFCQYIPAFFSGPIIGSIGDHYSRKWAIALSVFGLMASCLEMFIIANYAADHYSLLLLGWFLFGLSGSIFIFIGSCYSIVAHNIEQTQHSNEET